MQLIPAASILTYFKDGSDYRFLMGCRSQQHKFMPGVYVFPGGKVDEADVPADHANVTLSHLPHSKLGNLSREIGSFAIAALRELEEETGYSAETLVSKRSLELVCIARAITPPYPGPRYDTLFFLLEVERPVGLKPEPESAELECLGWYSLEETKGLPIAGITCRIQHQGLAVAKNGPETPFWGQLVGGI